MNDVKEVAVVEVQATVPCGETKVVKTQLSQADKDELEGIILEKIKIAKENYDLHLDAVKNPDGNSTSDHVVFKGQEDGQKTLSLEENSAHVERQQQNITHLQNALIRMKNGAYGRCTKPGCPCGGALMSMERLRNTPQAMECCLTEKLSNKQKRLQPFLKRQN